MIISVASGKGGTGKTTVAASLIAVWGSPVVAVDLDVEEPNLHLFLNPCIELERKVEMEVPVVDESKCTLCRACVDLCQFKAITIMGKILLPFKEMCHGCGGCLAICPEKALSPGARELGSLVQGQTQTGDFLMGQLRVGESMSPPLMRAVKKHLREMLSQQPRDAIIDAPPGVSCPAVNAVRDSDVIVLVTEPTPFGFHDFVLAREAFAPMGKPMVAIINRAGIGDDSIQTFCRENSIPIIAQIPFDRSIAEGYSKGRIVASLSRELEALFVSTRDALKAYSKDAGHA